MKLFFGFVATPDVPWNLEIFSLTNEREGEEGKHSRSASSRSSLVFGFISIFARVRLRLDLRSRSASSRSSLVFDFVSIFARVRLRLDLCSCSASSRSSLAFGIVSIFARVQLHLDLRSRSACSRSSLVFVSEKTSGFQGTADVSFVSKY